MDQIDAGGLREQHRGEMRRRSQSGVGDRQSILLAFREGDEFFHRRRRSGRVHDQHQHVGRDFRDRREVLDRIIWQLFVQARIDDMARCIEQQCVAIRSSPCDHLRAEIAAGAAAVFDDHRLAPRFVQLVGEHAAQCIRGAASRKRHDEADRPVRIALRPA
jgi:hypothetical protein